jgi:hypothetical protein
MKHKNNKLPSRPLDFFTTPSTPSKELSNNCALRQVAFFNLGSAEPLGSLKIFLGSAKYLKVRIP